MSLFFNLSYHIQQIDELSKKLKVENVDQKLQEISDLVSASEQLPAAIVQRVRDCKELEKTLYELKQRGFEDQIPKHAFAVLNQNASILSIVSDIKNIALFHFSTTPETKHLTFTVTNPWVSSPPLPEFLQEWAINLGLAMDAAAHTSDPVIQQRIRFLACNYLAKAAPHKHEKFTHDFGILSDYEYHRDKNEYFDQAQANTSQVSHPKWWIDHDEILDMYPTRFTFINTLGCKNFGTLIDALAQGMVGAVVQHYQDYPSAPSDHYFSRPVLLDLSDLMRDQIVENKGRSSDEWDAINKKRKETQETVRELIEQTVNRACVLLKTRHPQMMKDMSRSTLEWFLKDNICCVYRFRHQEACFLALMNDIPGFSSKEAKKRQKTWIDHFVQLTGIRIGAIPAREQLCAILSMNQLISNKCPLTHSALFGPNTKYFEKKEDFLHTAIFKWFFNPSEEKKAHEPPYMQVYRQRHAEIIEKLFQSISIEKWEALNANEAERMLLQQTLCRLLIHIDQASSCSRDPVGFFQAMELARSEIAAITYLTTPFTEEDFRRTYTQTVSPLVPPSLRDHIRVGLAKSAMNAFAGISAAVWTKLPNPHSVHGNIVYFEVAELMPDKTNMDHLQSCASATSTDFYAGEFHHNWTTGDKMEKMFHYPVGNVIGDVTILLQNHSDTHPLTIAIDSTMNYYDCPKIRELLGHFEREILAGQLNFIFFRSGQKFDFLSMDDYYGGPYWIVNNGAPQWQHFEQVLKSRICQTDRLTLQWYCLVSQQAIKEYMMQIDDNAKAVLHHLPSSFFFHSGKPAPKIVVYTADEDMNTFFIHVKISSPHAQAIYAEARDQFLTMFESRQSRAFCRDSFGFCHPNICFVDGDIRINPGLSPDDNQIIIQFIQSLPELCKKVEEQQQHSFF